MHDLYLKQFTTKFKKKKLLLHVCCAPDLVTPLIDLKNYFQLYLFWYNPNIQPFSEYQKRYKQYIKLLNLEKGDYKLVNGNGEIVEKFEENKNYNPYNIDEFFNKLNEFKEIVGIKNRDKKKLISEFAQMEEKNSIRCDLCYYLRLYEAALMAKKLKIDYFTTTLLISPKKSVEKLNFYGKMIAKKLKCKYISFNFRKNNGFAKAAKYTKKHGIRRQNYCGCSWSIRS